MAAPVAFVVKFLLVVGPRYHRGRIPRQALFLGLAFTLVGVMLHFATPADDAAATGRFIVKIFLLLMAAPLVFLSYAHQSFPAATAEAVRFAQAVLESLVKVL